MEYFKILFSKFLYDTFVEPGFGVCDIVFINFQLGEATLYAASLELMEACIKKLTLMKVFEKQVRYCRPLLTRVYERTKNMHLIGKCIMDRTSYRVGMFSRVHSCMYILIDYILMSRL